MKHKTNHTLGLGSAQESCPCPVRAVQPQVENVWQPPIDQQMNEGA